MKVKCAHCGKSVEKAPGAVNRAKAVGMRLFCNFTCSGAARRTFKPKAQKIAEKRAYDMEYRRKNLASIKAKKHAHFKRTYDPVAAAEVRRARMPKHVEYCRQPWYRRWKRRYDTRYRAEKTYGPFAEAFLALLKVDKEVNSRMTDYEVRQANGTGNKWLQRRRDYERTIRG
jgi:hypothetical protein